MPALPRLELRSSTPGIITCIIDADLPPLDDVIPNDKNHLHFGLGQTEARIELPPGRHTLQLLFGDDGHVPHKPPLYSAKITIIVPPSTGSAQ